MNALKKGLVIGLLMFAVSITGVAVGQPENYTNLSNQTYWQKRNCQHGHPYRVARRTIKRAVRSNRFKHRATFHYVICVEKASQYRRLRRLFERSLKWRRSYSGYWHLQAKQLSPATKAMLARLRGCETRGAAYPSNYRWDGHHKGAYQYDYRTWHQAQSYVGVPGRYRTAWAHIASPNHQDVVTGKFFPSHRGQWACSA